MNGTFNGIQLRKITSIKTSTGPSGLTRSTFRVLDGNPTPIPGCCSTNSESICPLSRRRASLPTSRFQRLDNAAIVFVVKTYG